MNAKRTLASVGEIEERGNYVYVSKKGGSGIHMTDGTWKPLHKKRGVYTLPIWIVREKDGTDVGQEHPNGRQH